MAERQPQSTLREDIEWHNVKMAGGEGAIPGGVLPYRVGHVCAALSGYLFQDSVIPLGRDFG